MTDIDWRKSYEIFIQAAELSIEEATKILQDLAERQHAQDLLEHGVAKQQYRLAAEAFRARTEGRKHEPGSPAKAAPSPPDKPRMYQAMFEVERNFCRINNSRLPEEARVDMSVDEDRPFHWYYWRELLPQGCTSEDCVSSGQRAFEFATIWASRHSGAEEVLKRTYYSKLDEDLPLPASSSAPELPKSHAGRRKTDPKSHRKPSDRLPSSKSAPNS